MPPPLLPPAPDARLLVIVSARIGDTLLATPLLKALKAACPAGVVGCRAHPKRLELLRGLACVDRLDGLTSGRARWLGRLPLPPAWDYALVLNHEAPLVAYALRVARAVVAYRQPDPALDGRLFRSVAVPPAMVAVEGRLALAEALGITTCDLSLAYQVLPDERIAARQWLQAQGLGDAAPLIGLQLCSFPSKAYRDWPLEHFAQLVQELLAAWPTARFLLLGGPDNRSLAETFAARFPGRAVSAAGRFALRQSAALISQLHLYVGVDTGPTHLAGALGIPMVALYHCRFRGRHLAPQQHARLRVLEHPHDDAQCSADSPMALIPVATVRQAAFELLAPARGNG